MKTPSKIYWKFDRFFHITFMAFFIMISISILLPPAAALLGLIQFNKILSVFYLLIGVCLPLAFAASLSSLIFCILRHSKLHKFLQAVTFGLCLPVNFFLPVSISLWIFKGTTIQGLDSIDGLRNFIIIVVIMWVIGFLTYAKYYDA